MTSQRAFKNPFFMVAPYRQLMRRSGTPLHALFPVEWNFVPLDTGGDSGGVLTIRDLSREKELQQDYDRLARVAEESPSPIIELDSDANLVYANPAMTVLLQRFGYTASGFPAVCPGELSRLVRRCLESGKRYEGKRSACPRQVLHGFSASSLRISWSEAMPSI